MKKALLPLLIFLIVHSFSVNAEPLQKNEQNIAINGYDVVSYFREKLAVLGNNKITAEYNGNTWQFRDSTNLETFLQNPEKFVPQYGGYCAYGTKFGLLYESDPRVFSIIDKKLYLTLDTAARKKWESQSENNILKADKKWEKIRHKKDPKVRKREIEVVSN